jgi:urease accessory protein
MTAHLPWRAQLDLDFARRAHETIMVRNRHEGPLLVQKALYPERRDVCHIAVLHPPGGIAAGDTLAVRSTLGPGSRVLLTTPGAAKWYRCDAPGGVHGQGNGGVGGERGGRCDDGDAGNTGGRGNGAEQNIHFSVGRDAVLEWLPRENIFFRASDISMNLDVALAGSANYLGWEILGFGRRAGGERWDRGRLRMRTSVRRDGRLLWLETADIDARSGFAASAVGLAGATVSGTMLVASGEVDDALLEECREVDGAARIGVTRVPGLLIARYLGNSTQDAFRWFTRLWAVLRPATLGREPCAPRVWAC